MNEQIPSTILPLADPRHVAFVEMKKQLDRGEATSNFESLRDELVEQLQNALSGVDILIAHNVCSLTKISRLPPRFINCIYPKNYRA